MAIKIMQISFAVPGRERKRTRLNAPAIATPAPIFPLTSEITRVTAAGMSAVEIKKLLEERERNQQRQAKATPHTRERARQIRTLVLVSCPLLKIVSKAFFKIVFPPVKAVR